MSLRISLAVFALICAPAWGMDSITVMSDASLSVPLSKIARDYSRSADIAVNNAFTTVKAQQAQIAEGGAVDVLITPMRSWIEELKTQGLVDVYSLTPVARNRLALAGPADSVLQADLSQKFPVAQMITALGWEPGLLVGNPETLQEGVYAKEALRNMDAASDMEPYTLYVKRLDQMFESASQRSYGIFFASTVPRHSGIRVLGLFPESTHSPIQYYAVVVAGEHMNQARKFIEYLKTEPARRSFRESGLMVEELAPAASGREARRKGRR